MYEELQIMLQLQYRHQIFCAQNKKMVFKETITAFERIDRFSKLMSQIKIHEHFNIFGGSDKKF